MSEQSEQREQLVTRLFVIAVLLPAVICDVIGISVMTTMSQGSNSGYCQIKGDFCLTICIYCIDRDNTA